MAVVTQIQFRRGTAAQWTSANPILAAGEMGWESDTGKAKIGNGSSAWNSLAYSLTGANGTVTSITAGTGLSGGTITSSGTIAIDSTVATLSDAQTLTNKNLTSGTNTFPTSLVTLTGSQALTNKDLTGAGNTFPSSLATISGTETLTNKTLTAPVVNLALNAQTGTTYTFVLTDNGKLVTASNASAQTYTIPLNASVAFATGAQINIISIGAGQVTIQGTGGVTVASTGATATAPKLRAQYSSATLIKVATDTWYVVGDIA